MAIDAARLLLTAGQEKDGLAAQPAS
jgi:hypothetical protein